LYLQRGLLRTELRAHAGGADPPPEHGRPRHHPYLLALHSGCEKAFTLLHVLSYHIFFYVSPRSVRSVSFIFGAPFSVFRCRCPAGYRNSYDRQVCVLAPPDCPPGRRACGRRCIAGDQTCPCGESGDGVDCTQTVINAGRNFIIVIFLSFVALFSKSIILRPFTFVDVEVACTYLIFTRVQFQFWSWSSWSTTGGGRRKSSIRTLTTMCARTSLTTRTRAAERTI